jgi:hypothetical protein
LIGIEWNALTYAGATVWNVRGPDGKRRPREAWQIQPATHEALISSDEAEQILGRLERKTSVRMKGAAYLLSGILVAPDGRRWHGDGDGSYRCGRAASAPRRSSARVLEQARRDLTARRSSGAACSARARASGRAIARPSCAAAAPGAELERKAGRIRNVIAEMQHPQGMIRELDKLEAQRLELERRAAAAAEASPATRSCS